MQRVLLLIFIALMLYQCHNETLQPVDYVNTLIGTHANQHFSHGNTYPAVTRPWGMNFWTAQTGVMKDTWTYTYNLINQVFPTRQTNAGVFSNVQILLSVVLAYFLKLTLMIT